MNSDISFDNHFVENHTFYIDPCESLLNNKAIDKLKNLLGSSNFDYCGDSKILYLKCDVNLYIIDNKQAFDRDVYQYVQLVCGGVILKTKENTFVKVFSDFTKKSVLDNILWNFYALLDKDDNLSYTLVRLRYDISSIIASLKKKKINALKTIQKMNTFLGSLQNEND